MLVDVVLHKRHDWPGILHDAASQKKDLWIVRMDQGDCRCSPYVQTSLPDLRGHAVAEFRVGEEFAEAG